MPPVFRFPKVIDVIVKRIARVELDAPIPEGTNVIGAVSISPIPLNYDYIGYTYTGNNITTIEYKSGGAAGTVVSTRTLAYDASNNITSDTIT